MNSLRTMSLQTEGGDSPRTNSVPVVTALSALHHALSFIHFPVQLGPQQSMSLFEPAFKEGRACVISTLAPETCRQVCLPHTQQKKKKKELMNSVTSVF